MLLVVSFLVVSLVSDPCIDPKFSSVVSAGFLSKPTFIPKKSLSAAALKEDNSNSSALPWVVRHGCSTQADPLKSETKKRSASAGKNGMAVVRSHVVADHKTSRSSSSGGGTRTGGSKRAPTSASKKQKQWNDDDDEEEEDDDDDEEASDDEEDFDAADGDDDDGGGGGGGGSRRVSIRAQTKPRKNYAVDGDDEDEDDDEEENGEDEDEDDEQDDEVNECTVFF